MTWHLIDELDLTIDDAIAEIKLDRALRRAETAERQHGTRVAALPGVLDGQPHIEGTRLTVARLLLELALRSDGELEQLHSLPPDWLPAIVRWVHAQARGDDDA